MYCSNVVSDRRFVCVYAFGGRGFGQRFAGRVGHTDNAVNTAPLIILMTDKNRLTWKFPTFPRLSVFPFCTALCLPRLHLCDQK